jgi:catechol 2,3-dioxygenase-like lactoylglutathione lyase family enzyme
MLLPERTFGCRIMGKSLLTWLFFAFSLVAILPSGARAATLYGSDYARVGVPDLAQAVTFFQDVLDCRLIGPESAATGAAPASRLLSCDTDSIVELYVISPSPASNEAAQPLRFVSGNVLHADEWLRHQGGSISGAPHRLTSGPLAGRMVLDFVAPWGLRLQLLDNSTDGPADGILATTNISFDGN